MGRPNRTPFSCISLIACHCIADVCLSEVSSWPSATSGVCGLSVPCLPLLYPGVEVSLSASDSQGLSLPLACIMIVSDTSISSAGRLVLGDDPQVAPLRSE